MDITVGCEVCEAWVVPCSSCLLAFVDRVFPGTEKSWEKLTEEEERALLRNKLKRRARERMEEEKDGE